MVDKAIFCNIPWFEININHDGSYDLCGCQNDKIVDTPLGQVYNIKRLPIQEYWNSDRMRNSRMIKMGTTPDPMCRMCQTKDQTGYLSNRVKENNKSVIFREAFERSFQQSPHRSYFEYSHANQGETTSDIRSLHINLGSTCNFACRMCGPRYSTRLQTEYKLMEWVPKTASYQHWTDDDSAWQNFVSFLDQQAKNVRVVHIIGGEVEFIPKFGWLIDYFIDRNLASQINFSFTTNGSLDYSHRWHQLSQYKRCEIGVSIESVDKIGDYIRQGGEIQAILYNIDAFAKTLPENFRLVIRTVPSLLSLPTYANLIRWTSCRGLPIDNSLLVHPLWLQATLLPEDIKQNIIADLSAISAELPDSATFINQKDSNRVTSSTRNECDSMINLCRRPAPPNADNLRRECADRLGTWDRLKNINLKNYHQGLYAFLEEYGYHGS